MTENERNQVIAECAQTCESEALYWNDYLETLDPDSIEAGFAMVRSMQCTDNAEAIRRLSPDYAEITDAHEHRLRKWIRGLINGEKNHPLPYRGHS